MVDDQLGQRPNHKPSKLTTMSVYQLPSAHLWHQNCFIISIQGKGFLKALVRQIDLFGGDFFQMSKKNSEHDFIFQEHYVFYV